ncbi:T9SS type A sorting domain-containing protein [Winogradskyella sp. 3972H.M.0a.05]|uniref:T9SS type A sorting domain-containing protein n=1 Tax=Winogradskyella sp. 3972H.M.0a.05 TaxID=2950277 RepID=UPI00339103FD
MKRLLQIILMTLSFSLMSQNYQFGIVSDYNNTGNPYEFTFVATPDFDNAAPNFADIQLTVSISTGNTMQVNSFTEIIGTNWQVNTGLTGSTLQGFGAGDGSRDLWIFSLPVPTSALTTPHSTGQEIPLLSFVVDNDPDSGSIAILENDDPIAVALAGIGFVVDNVINVDLDDGNGTQNYYGSTDPNNNEFIFQSLSIEEITEDTSDITLYPNPARDEVMVKATNISIDEVEIFTIEGRRVLQIDNVSGRIDISQLPSAVYIVKLYSDSGKSKTIKLVKE